MHCLLDQDVFAVLGAESFVNLVPGAVFVFIDFALAVFRPAALSVDKAF